MEERHFGIWLLRVNTFPSKWLKTIKSIIHSEGQSPVRQFDWVFFFAHRFCLHVGDIRHKVNQKLTNAQNGRKPIHSTSLWCPWLADSDEIKIKGKLNPLKFPERSEGHHWHSCHWPIWLYAILTQRAYCSYFDLCPIISAPLSPTVLQTRIYHQIFI